MKTGCGVKWWLGWLLVLVLPLNAAAASTELAQTRAQLAVEYMRYGNMRAALDAANASVDSDGSYQSGHLVRALILMQLGMDKDAEGAFRRAMALDAGNPEVNNNYGWFLCSRGRVADAIPLFTRALADPLYDKPQTAYLNRGLCRTKLGEYTAANADLLAALRVNGRDTAALRAMVDLQLAQRNARLADFYYQRLRAQQGAATAPDLWLAIRLARLQGDSAAEKKHGESLVKSFPDSMETQQYLSGS